MWLDLRLERGGVAAESWNPSALADVFWKDLRPSDAVLTLPSPLLHTTTTTIATTIIGTTTTISTTTKCCLALSAGTISRGVALGARR